MKKKAVSISEEVLKHFGVDYRKFPCGNGAFFYCKIPSSGYTFDLQCDEDGVIRLWRFVATVPIYMAGKRCECRKLSYPHAVTGIEITDEGDVSFFAEQKMDLNDSSNIERIVHMIERYMSMIANIKLA